MLEKRRRKISTTGEVNLFHELIDRELEGIEGALLHLDHQQDVRAACIVELRSYQEEKPPALPRPSRRGGTYQIDYEALLRDIRIDAQDRLSFGDDI